MRLWMQVVRYIMRLPQQKNVQIIKKQTGVDLVVANLGTEHRASGKDLRYHQTAAKAIKSMIGAKIVLMAHHL